MPQETELKLCLDPADLPRLRAHPLLTAEPHTRHLLNTYFDTPDHALAAARMAVRERTVDGQTVLTVKTAGRSSGGLSRRGEWEAPTQPGAFDFAALVDDAPLADRLQALRPGLQPLFRTDFVRHTWVLLVDQARVEVALDQGQISVPDRLERRAEADVANASEPLLELELELLQGPEDALHQLAHQLARLPDGSALTLIPSDRSKAERGMALYLASRSNSRA